MKDYLMPIILIIADIIAIPVVIKMLMKKYSENKKKMKAMIVAFVAVLLIVDAVAIGVPLLSGISYDRDAKMYMSAEDVVYYSESGDKFTLQTVNGKQYFINEQETRMMLADRVYADEDGYITLDVKKSFTPNGDGSYSDKDGKKYYPAINVEWNSNGEMIVKN